MTRTWQFAIGGMLAIAVLWGTPVPARLRSALGVWPVCWRSPLRLLLYHRAHKVSGGRGGVAADARHACATCLRPRQRARTAGATAGEPAGGRDRRALLQLVSLALAAHRADAHAADRAGQHLEGRRLIQRGAAAFHSDVSISRTADEDVAAAGVHAAVRQPHRGAGVGGSALIAVLALVLARSPAYERNLQAIASGVSYQERDRLAGRPRACRNSATSNLCVVGAPNDPSVMVMGDSHALVLTPARRMVGESRRQNPPSCLG